MPRPRVPHKKINGKAHKHCKKCDTWYLLSGFDKQNKCWDGFDTRCKKCKSQYSKNRIARVNEKKKLLAKNKIMDWIKNNKKSIISFSKNVDWNDFCEKIEYIRIKKIMRDNNTKKQSKRYKEDFIFRLKELNRKRIQKAIKNNFKSKSSAKLLGCNVNFLKSHLENQFDEKMSWENIGNWHIDHIVPCDYFNLKRKKDQLMCFNYRNLQPMWASDNISKSNRLTKKSKLKIIELKKLRFDVLDDESSSEEDEEIKTKKKLLRQKKISTNLKLFNKTQAGKFIKKKSHIKRSKTMDDRKKKIRDKITEKECRKCNTIKPKKEFNRKSAAKDGLQSYCNDCIYQLKKERRKNNTKIYRCIECNKTYKSQGSLTRHKKLEHPPPPTTSSESDSEESESSSSDSNSSDSSDSESDSE